MSERRRCNLPASRKERRTTLSSHWDHLHSLNTEPSQMIQRSRRPLWDETANLIKMGRVTCQQSGASASLVAAVADLKKAFDRLQTNNPIEAAMFLSRPAFAAARRAAVSPIVKRSFTSSFVRSTPSAGLNYSRRC